MWRLLPILAVLGFLEVLVPWPDVAALVLGNGGHADRRATTVHVSLPVEMHRASPPQLVQVRDASR
ncbi:MAG TPA: hypothetical protein VKB68_12570 [Stellaceae bacterium]|nr:hypothetical protein [Stellaceae bacterium]